MYHSLQQLVDKIEIMLNKAKSLEAEHMYRSKEEVQYRIDDVRALAGDIYNDIGENRNDS
jgi:hypothetical protein